MRAVEAPTEGGESNGVQEIVERDGLVVHKGRDRSVSAARLVGTIGRLDVVTQEGSEVLASGHERLFERLWVPVFLRFSARLRASSLDSLSR